MERRAVSLRQLSVLLIPLCVNTIRAPTVLSIQEETTNCGMIHNTHFICRNEHNTKSILFSISQTVATVTRNQEYWQPQQHHSSDTWWRKRATLRTSRYTHAHAFTHDTAYACYVYELKSKQLAICHLVVDYTVNNIYIQSCKNI